MANLTFRIIESQKPNSPARIVADITAFRKRKRIATSARILPEEWNQSKQRPKPTCISRKLVDRELRRVRKVVDDAYYSKADDGASAFFNAISQKMSQQKEDSLSIAWGKFIEASNYAHRTEQKMATTLRLLLDFKPTAKPSDMGLQFIDGFKNYLFGRNLTNETASKYVQCVKRFMSWSYDRGIHSCADFQHPDYSVPRQEKIESVALTEEEVMQIASVQLPERLEASRDLFLWMCYTGQRWSDVERIESAAVVDGLLIYTPHKTRKHNTVVKVPLVGYSSPAVGILDKCDGKLPKMASQVFNRQVKEICELAKITGTFQKSRISGKDETVMHLSRREYVSAHTGRRTFATVLLTKGVPMNIVAKLTGHKSIRTLQKYEQASTDYAIQMYVQNFS